VVRGGRFCAVVPENLDVGKAGLLQYQHQLIFAVFFIPHCVDFFLEEFLFPPLPGPDLASLVCFAELCLKLGPTPSHQTMVPKLRFVHISLLLRS
jgi:hypothetical protein